MAFLETSDLGQKYGDRYVLKHINLGIEKSEVFALIGPTGAGKTTLLRLVNLLELPASGKIYCDGMDIISFSAERVRIRRRMSFVQQKPVVFTLSVYDNIACGLKWRGVRKEIIQQNELKRYRIEKKFGPSPSTRTFTMEPPNIEDTERAARARERARSLARTKEDLRPDRPIREWSIGVIKIYLDEVKSKGLFNLDGLKATFSLALQGTYLLLLGIASSPFAFAFLFFVFVVLRLE